MISKSTLNKWRKDALENLVKLETIATNDGVDKDLCIKEIQELSKRILRLTQELLDIDLLRR